jgi:hypothetical protein
MKLLLAETQNQTCIDSIGVKLTGGLSPHPFVGLGKA